MWVEDLKLNSEKIIDLNTAFEESLDSGFYVINKDNYESRKVIVCMTRDWQYSFYFAIENWRIEMLWKRKEPSVWYTLDEYVSELQWFFSFQHDYNPVDNYKKLEFKKEVLNNVWDLKQLLVELKKEEVVEKINNLLH